MGNNFEEEEEDEYEYTEKEEDPQSPLPFRDLLPVLSPFPLPEVTEESTLKEVVREDVEQMNIILQGLHQQWSKANTITKVCKLAMTQTAIITQRRKLLLKPVSYSEYQGAHDPKKKTFEFEPL